MARALSDLVVRQSGTVHETRFHGPQVMTAKNPTKDAQNHREHREDEGDELVGATPHHVDDQGGQPQPKDHARAMLCNTGCSG